jgi:DNA polymerase
MAGCIPYLLRQIDLIHPRLIVCLGSTAMIGLLGNIGPISRVRGTWHDFHGIPVLPTFHPAYLLRDPSRKRFAWADLKTVMARLSPPT